MYVDRDLQHLGMQVTAHIGSTLGEHTKPQIQILLYLTRSACRLADAKMRGAFQKGQSCLHRGYKCAISVHETDIHIHISICIYGYMYISIDTIWGPPIGSHLSIPEDLPKPSSVIPKP